jgi:predicted nucleic acid-binding protein
VIIAATAAASDRIVLTTDAAGFVDLPGVEVRLLGT